MSVVRSFTRHLSRVGRRQISSVLDEWTHEFKLRGVDEPKLSADYIISHVLGFPTLSKYKAEGNELENVLSEEEMGKISSLCRRRMSGLPIQYVISEWDFHGLTLKMKPPVFIPRPETEELVELASHHLITQHSGRRDRVKVLEVGCGSGCISLALVEAVSRGIDKSVERVEQSVERVNESVGRVNQSVEGVDQSVERVNESVERVEQSVERVNESVERVNQSVEGVNQSVERVNQSVERVNQSVERVNQSVEGVNQSVTLDILSIDCDVEAVRLATQNAQKISEIIRGGNHRLEVKHVNLYDLIGCEDKFDMIISNPPYIPSHSIPHLPEGVRRNSRHSLLWMALSRI